MRLCNLRSLFVRGLFVFFVMSVVWVYLRVVNDCRKYGYRIGLPDWQTSQSRACGEVNITPPCRMSPAHFL
jgi:hypothetical protein